MIPAEQQRQDAFQLMLQSFQTQLSFYHHLTLVSATLLGILLAFHPSASTPLLPRLLFLLAVALLSAGILLLTSVSHACTLALRTFYQKVRNAVEASTSSGLPVRYTRETLSPKILRRAAWSYRLLLASLVLLVAYAALVLFP